MFNNWQLIATLAVLIIIFLIISSYRCPRKPLPKPGDRPEKERFKAPEPIITNDPPIYVVNNSGGDTTITLNWWCSFAEDHTVYSPQEIAFRIEIFDESGDILPEQTQYYTYKDSFDKVDPNDMYKLYYKAVQTSETGFQDGDYTLRLTSFVRSRFPKVDDITSASNDIRLEVCTPSCVGKGCGDDGCGSNDNCGTCEAPNSCIDNECICQPQCDGTTCGGDGCKGQCTCDGGGVCKKGLCVEPDILAFYNQKDCGDTFNANPGCPYTEYQDGDRYIAIDWYLNKNDRPDGFTLYMTGQTSGFTQEFDLTEDDISYQLTPFPDISGNLNEQGGNPRYYRYLWEVPTVEDGGEFVTTELFATMDPEFPYYADGKIKVRNCECDQGECTDTCGYPSICVVCTDPKICHDGECCSPDCTDVDQGGSDGCGGVCGSLGCWYDKIARAMPTYLIGGYRDQQPSLQDCKNEAKKQNKKYFGLQDYNESSGTYGQCWSTNDPGTIGTRNNPGQQGYQMFGQAATLEREPVWSASGDVGCYMKDIKGKQTFVGSRWINAAYDSTV